MCNAHSIPLENTDAFAERLVDTLNGGALSLMISLGYRAGLFERLAELDFVTPKELAEAAGLNERYVAEWLGAMACAQVVEAHPKDPSFRLPKAHRSSLTRAGGADNMAGFTQYIGMLGQVEDDILRCFREGGGLGYDSFPRFHEVMAEDSGQSVLSSLFESILPLVPGLTRRLQQGIDVLDLGCGRGKALLAMAQRYPFSRFTGYDLCDEPLQEAIAEAKSLGLHNVRFERLDATTLDQSKRYDFIATFDAIHDQARPDLVLRNIRKALRTDGYYLMQDIDAASETRENLAHPLGTFLYTISTMHCMTVSLSSGGLGLGTMWGREKANELLRGAGFQRISEHLLPHDQQNRYYVFQA